MGVNQWRPTNEEVSQVNESERECPAETSSIRGDRVRQNSECDQCLCCVATTTGEDDSEDASDQ